MRSSTVRIDLHLMIPRDHDTVTSPNPTSTPTSTPTPFRFAPSMEGSVEMPLLPSSFANSSLAANLSPDYNTTQPSSSGQPATPNDSYSQNTMPDPSSYQISDLMPNFGTGMMYSECLPEESVDIGVWMGDEPTFAPGSINPWETATKKKAQGIIDQINKCLPPVQNKRSWSRHHTQSDNEEEDANSRRRKKSTALTNTPVYALNIPQNFRPLKDSDFESSMEWCPFYLYEPFKFYPKPWTSCTKQRAEISHIITHMISDHGLIRGSNSKRKSQRYLTRCDTDTHDDARKGKSSCTTCSQVEHWTEEQIEDPKHAGSSLCLRCYTELATKEDLYQHLHETNICLYHEDFPMIQKSRILYTIFCSSTEVPKFNPPSGASAPRDGARKRNMKGARRAGASTTESQNKGQVSSQPIVKANPQQPHSILPPTHNLSPKSKGANSEPNEDRSSSVFPTMQPAPPHQIKQPRTLVHRQPLPSRSSERDPEPVPYQTFPQTCHMNPCDNLSSLHSTTLGAQSLQPPAMQPANKYHAYDSGIGSDMGGTQSQPAFEEPTYQHDERYAMTSNDAQSFFAEAWFNLPGWGDTEHPLGLGYYQNWQ